ncbi:MAG: metallophosphoesterase family protein [Gemmataceae bacterium]
MKLGILSDSHDRVERIELALAEFQKRGVERLIHCGDITGPTTVYAFAGWTVDFTLGNCDWDPDALDKSIREMGGTLHPEFGDLELAGKRIAWTHSHNAMLFRRLEHSDDYDYLFYGHTHVAEQHITGRTLVMNPGALHRVRDKQCAVLDLSSGQIETIWLGE